MAVQTLEPPKYVRQKSASKTKITCERAISKANNYLTKRVSISFCASDPVLLPLERPVWQVMVYFKLPYLERLPVAFLDVDVETGEVDPFSNEQIELYLDRADAYAKLHSPSATEAV